MNGNKSRSLRRLTKQVVDSSEHPENVSARKTYKNLKINYKKELQTVNQKN